MGLLGFPESFQCFHAALERLRAAFTEEFQPGFLCLRNRFFDIISSHASRMAVQMLCRYSSTPEGVERENLSSSADCVE